MSTQAKADASGAVTLTLATWKQQIDQGTLQSGEEHLAATARPAAAPG